MTTAPEEEITPPPRTKKGRPSARKTPRPSYSSRGTRPLPAKQKSVLQPGEEFKDHGLMAIPEKVFKSTSLRGRMMMHIVAASSVALVLMGFLLATTGIMKVNNAEKTTIDAVHTELNNYAKEVTSSSAKQPLTTTRDILHGFLAAKPPISGSSILGFIDGKLKMHQATKETPAYDDKELIETIEKNVDRSVSRQFRVTTSKTTYTVGTIPLNVEGSDPGYLVIALDHTANAATTWNMLRIFAGVSLLGLVLILAITSRMAGRVLSPIANLQKMMSTIASGDDLTKRLPIQGDHDLQEVATTFNGMIDRLQDSFDSQYNLLNDIGHELRTPLTIIHGHVELMNPENSTEVEHTRHLVLDEIDRMHRMTEDLVTVATMNRPDFLRPERMLVPDLTVDVFEHASQLSDNNWRLAHVADVEIIADYQRLIQAFLQLCQNASKFTEPGSIIEIGSHVDQVAQVVDEDGRIHQTQTITAPIDPTKPVIQADHYVYLWVRDRGIGIEPINQSRIFERFARVDHSRPGSGLGLSIVDAIAQAHGGWLEAQSVAGVGSVFAIALPVHNALNTQLKGE